MSHSIALPDDLYERLAALAERQGQSVRDLVRSILLQAAQSAAPNNSASRLDWDTASAEEIIADIRSRRMERERPPEL